MLDVRSFRRADCDTDYYVVIAKVRERLAISKEAAQKFVGGKFNLRKINELEIKKEYQMKISKSFAVLQNLSYSEDINRAWENTKRLEKSQLKGV